MVVGSLKCPVCDKGTSDCGICSGDSCTGDSTCEGSYCYFEKCCGQDDIVEAGCTETCASEMDLQCSGDPCHCSVCCQNCDEAAVNDALKNGCSK